MKAKRFSLDGDTMGVLTQVRGLLASRGIEGYLTGGYIRDRLIGRASLDIDIVVNAPAMQVARFLAESLDSRFVPLDEENEIARVVLAADVPDHMDLSTMRGDIADDLSLRDFTIDAMAISLNDIDIPDPNIINPSGGLEDLRAGVVRSVSEEGLRRDPLRLLRAVRLAAECGFSIEGATAEQIERHHRLVATVAAERIRDEICRLLDVAGSAGWLRKLDELGLLLAVLPELAPCKGEPQPKEHFWDVLAHSVETVATIEFLLHISDVDYLGEQVRDAVPWYPQMEDYFAETISSGHSRLTLLKLAGLLHDIAKPQTKTVEAGGRMRFLGHSQEGAAVAGRIMDRLRFSNRERDMVAAMIEHHLRPGQMARDEEMPTRRAIYRYFRDTGDVGIDTIFLNLADHLAARGPTLEFDEWLRHARAMEYVIDNRLSQDNVASLPRLITGHDLIEKFGISPGPRIGMLLEAVREAQAAGEIANRDEALTYAGGLLKGAK